MNVIARGREAEILDAGGGLVLRRYLDRRDTSAEVALHRHVAAHGYPVPHLVAGAPGGMLLERVEGPTLLEALVSGQVDVDDAALTLADLHRRLHRLPVPPGTLQGDCVLHLDLHPANVLLADRGPVVIDWASGAVGHRDLDVTQTAMVLAEVVVAGIAADSGDVASSPVPTDVVRRLLGAYLVADHGGSPVARLEEIVARRLRDGMRPAAVTAAAAHLRTLVGT
ncbi:phosphotransferase [Cellulomonas soli]|uniref:Aminoglycoside phosphotransferase domain-containing protein n=1 Tax=Cellulomonas soli TaxID=931535 RepID=A0A512PA38_9CELL|nr:phosphotransferase [Cellulomonas soli]NYI60550.1 tRNA A-37 threonylcarbamoyl transferase component Bud32 [Cellulomonas soli]GEP68065.1 hypothetical protein CSO01_07800 [Cellulomonas soli]